MLTVRHMRYFHLSRGIRVLTIIDKTSNLGSVMKGRSCYSALKNVPRKIVHILLGSHITLLLHLIPSQPNPVEKPSRIFEHESDHLPPKRAQNVAPLRKSSMECSTFQEWTHHVDEILLYMRAHRPTINETVDLDVDLCRYHVYLYDLNHQARQTETV